MSVFFGETGFKFAQLIRGKASLWTQHHLTPKPVQFLCTSVPQTSSMPWELKPHHFLSSFISRESEEFGLGRGQGIIILKKPT